MPKTTTEVDHNVGARIKARRQAMGLSQTALAREVGVTFQQVQKYEKGQNRIGAGRMQVIAKLLEVDVSYFFEGDAARPSAVSEFLCTAEGVRLAQVFVGLQDIEDRRMLLKIAERFARIDDILPDNDLPSEMPMAAE